MNLQVDIRDYFAVHAPPEIGADLSVSDLRPLLGFSERQKPYGWNPTSEEWAIGRCIRRYQWADAMLKARERK